MLPKLFAKKIKDALARNEQLFKSASAEASAHVLALQKEVTSTVLRKKGFTAAYLGKINKELVAAGARLADRLTDTVHNNQDAAWKLGSGVLSSSLKATVGYTLPVLTDKLLISAKDYSADLIKDLASELVDKISADIRRGIVLGENPYDTMVRVENHLFQEDGGAFFRAETIVRTENGRLFEMANQAQFESAAKEIPGLKKIWVPGEEDGRNRESHLQAGVDYGPRGNPGPIPIDEPFVVNGVELMYPGDPAGDPRQVINCRCSSQPWINDWEKDVASVVKEEPVQEGGVGSGNFGHAGRPGEIGGSSSAEGVVRDILKDARLTYGVSVTLGFVDSIPVEQDGIVYQAMARLDPASGEMLINRQAFSRRGDLNAVGYKSSGTLSLGWKALAYHEIGHAIDLRARITKTAEFKKLNNSMVVSMMNEGKKSNWGGFVSQYASSSMAENFAESFAVYKMNPGWLEKNNPRMFALVKRYV